MILLHLVFFLCWQSVTSCQGMTAQVLQSLLRLCRPCCAGQHDDDKRRMLQQIVLLDKSYHGGLKQYITNARQLLADSKEGGPCGS